MAPKAVRRAEREDEARRVRARLNEHEGQIEDLQGTTRHHDLRSSISRGALQMGDPAGSHPHSLFCRRRTRISALPRPHF